MAPQAPARLAIPAAARSDDELAALSAAEVAAFYRRLAQLIERQRTDSLAAKMLLHWLDGKGLRLTFDRAYVQDLGYVKTYLETEVRPVFLSQKQASVKGGRRWGGIVPRIKGMPPHPLPPKDARELDFSMMYEGPSVSIPMGVQAKAAVGLADPNELDLFMSLHTFGLRTEVVARAVRRAASALWDVTFTSWQTHAFDRYDWDPKKHLTVPNPDHGAASKLARPVAPTRKTVKVYHSNAKRVEHAGLAAAYDAVSTPWAVADPRIAGPGLADASRSL